MPDVKIVNAATRRMLDVPGGDATNRLLIGIRQGFVPGVAICAAKIADVSFASVVTYC